MAPKENANDPWWLRQLQREKQTMKESPISFTLCVLIITALLGVGIYWLEERHFNGTISQMDATIRAKDATIATLNTQLSGANRDNDKLTKQNDDLKIYRGKDAPPPQKERRNSRGSNA